MKRYLLFGFDTYYPRGGMNDLITSFDLVEELKLSDVHLWLNHFQVFDLEKQSKFGVNLGWELELLIDKMGEDFSITDERREEVLLNLIKNGLK
jgi:hypothetical protein